MDYHSIPPQLHQLEWLKQSLTIMPYPDSLVEHSGSMTALLKTLSSNQSIEVEVLQETPSANGLSWEREVLLLVQGVACIWACSAIPMSLRPTPLKQCPLGQWLFVEHQVKRTPFLYSKIQLAHNESPIRRSQLCPEHSEPIDVIECFLPGILTLMPTTDLTLAHSSNLEALK